MNSDAFLKENVTKDINVNQIPSLVKAESVFEDCETKDRTNLECVFSLHAFELIQGLV